MALVKLYYTDQEVGTPPTNRHWELNPGNLFVVDSIEDYLATKSYKSVTLQYIKNELEIGITIDTTQIGSQPKGMQYRYVSIQNTGESAIYYYFVKNVMWRSKSAVRLELVMDCLNTFKEGAAYTFKENTKITREHKDRFIYDERKRVIELVFSNPSLVGTINELDNVYLYNEHGTRILTGVIESIDANDYANIRITSTETDETILQDIASSIETEDYFEIVVISAPYNYLRFNLEREEDYFIRHYYQWWNKIDFISENINPSLIRKQEASKIQKTGILQQNWYLLYRNQNEPNDEATNNTLVNPVECYLIPEEEVDTDSSFILNGKLIPSWIETGKYYYFAVTSGQVTLSNGVTLTYGAAGRLVLLVTKANNTLSVTFFYCFNGYGNDAIVVNNYDGIDYLTFNSLPVSYIIENQFLNTGTNDYYALQDDMPYEFDNSEEVTTIDSIKELDRTDAKNIKLIKLPYIPFDFQTSSTYLRVEGLDEWEVASFEQSGGGYFKALKLLDESTKLQGTINANLNNPFDLLKKASVTPSITDLRSQNDPKLYHSDFFSPSYVYDSFTIKVDLEKCNLEWYIENNTNNNNIKFTMTSTINSKFMFTLAQYHNNKAESNFYNVLPVARNNEMVLYNVPYINYIRTGYQYDIKNKNISNISNAIGLGLSVASVGASLLAPSVPLKVAGVVASVVSVAQSVKSTIVSTIQNENAIQQKLKQSQNQAASVSGSDDVDLMSEYCDNRLLYMVYEPTDVMKSLLNDLFFYGGYRSERMGLPNHNTRCNFDCPDLAVLCK